jgi:hypothetical protein
LPKLTDKVDNAVCDTERAGGFHTASDELDRRLELVRALAVALAVRHLLLHLAEVLLRQASEAGHKRLANKRLGSVQVALLGHLDLQLAATEFEVHQFLDAGSFARGRDGLVLGNDIAASDSKVDSALADEGGDVGGREEDQGQRQVLHQGNVEAVVTVELDVGAGEQLDAGLVQTALFGHGEQEAVVQAADEVSQGGQGAAEAAGHGAVLVQAGSLHGGGGGLLGEGCLGGGKTYELTRSIALLAMCV